MRLRYSSLKSYGPFQLFWLSICYINTKIFFPKAKLIRLPIFMRNKKKIIFGKNFVCGYFNRLDAFGLNGCIHFGSNVQLNDNVHIGAMSSILVGNDVLIASRVFISDHNHGSYSDILVCSSPEEPPINRVEQVKSVVIGDRVWIGEGASILPGVSIGSGAIIGAGAVVTSDIPSNCIAVGAPARVIREYDSVGGLWVRISS